MQLFMSLTFFSKAQTQVGVDNMGATLRKSQLSGLLSVNEAAATLGVRKDTIYRLIKAGDVPAYRIGRLKIDPYELLEATAVKVADKWEFTGAVTPSGLTSLSATKELDAVLKLITAKRPKNIMTS